MSKWEPKTYVLKNGQTLLLREAVPDDAPRVLAYLNRVGGESDNLLFGKDGFPMPVERERAFLESQRKEEKSIMLAGFVGEELVAIASCDALTARERVAHRAGLSVTVGRGFWGLGIGRKAMEVRSDNERAVALYEHLGFEKMGLYKKFMKVDGRDFDAWYMNLYL